MDSEVREEPVTVMISAVVFLVGFLVLIAWMFECEKTFTGLLA